MRGGGLETKRDPRYMLRECAVACQIGGRGDTVQVSAMVQLPQAAGKSQQLTLSLGVLSFRVNRLQLSSDKLSKHLHTCECCATCLC